MSVPPRSAPVVPDSALGSFTAAAELISTELGGVPLQPCPAGHLLPELPAQSPTDPDILMPGRRP